MNCAAWDRLMSALESPPNEGEFERLVAAYSERHRHYHTVEHLRDCLEQLEQARELAQRPDEVELALWFHDAIYKTRSKTNERDSADWARRFLQGCGADEERCARVHALVLATEHDAAPPLGDPTLLVDIDLSILGRSPEVYDRFEQQIRREYAWVPRPLYRRKRAQVLQSFLDRAAIYGSDRFRERYEDAARRNLIEAIRALR